MAIGLLLASPATAQRDESADRAEIHALLVAYGATLDARDFEAFAALFAEDGVYAAGGGAEVPGAAAGEMMRKVFAENALGFREPNFHLFLNEVVTFDGPDSAHATLKSLYMAPGDDGRPVAAMMAAYENDLVREGERWKFRRLKVIPLMPAR